MPEKKSPKRRSDTRPYSPAYYGKKQEDEPETPVLIVDPASAEALVANNERVLRDAFEKQNRTFSEIVGRLPASDAELFRQLFSTQNRVLERIADTFGKAVARLT